MRRKCDRVVFFKVKTLQEECEKEMFSSDCASLATLLLQFLKYNLSLILLFSFVEIYVEKNKNCFSIVVNL